MQLAASGWIRVVDLGALIAGVRRGADRPNTAYPAADWCRPACGHGVPIRHRTPSGHRVPTGHRVPWDVVTCVPNIALLRDGAPGVAPNGAPP
ncbi:hypothetical protein GCM10009566_46560 [Streptomyces murinus]